MNLGKGDNFTVFINDSGVWKPYICATSVSVNIVTESIETSVSGNGLWASFAPTKNSFTASANGNVSLNDPASLTLVELQQKQIAQEIFLIQFLQTADDGSTYTKYGYCFITGSSDTGSFDGVATFSINFQGTGALTLDFELPPPPGTSRMIRQITGLGYVLCQSGDYIQNEN